MIKDKFDLWWEQAKPETILKAKLKAIDQGNAYIRQALINPDERMLKAILRIMTERASITAITVDLKTDDDIREHLTRLRNDPDGWVHYGNYQAKWDPATRTVIRRQAPIYRDRRWNHDDLPE